MVSSRHLLTVFMASPGDVASERAELAGVVNRINRRSAQDLGWQIELRGWEDTMPGMGRPQERINPDVEMCDVFIGILWRRWGTPTGISSSGFHEEYEIARARRDRSDEPEILMYFKTIDSAQMNDPGVQLEQVMSFRAELTASRKVLYKEYGSVEDFSVLVEEHLTRILLSRALAHAGSEHSASALNPVPLPASRVPAPEAAVTNSFFGRDIELQTLVGNPYLETLPIALRWLSSRKARKVVLAPCAVGCGQLWSLNAFDPDFGLTLIVGPTGSGKSNAIRAIAFSLALSIPPECIKFSVLDFEKFQSLKILKSIGATVLPAAPSFDVEPVLQEARRREKRLSLLGHHTLEGLWRNEPALRKDFPVWMIFADEASHLVQNTSAMDELIALAGRMAGLGIHFVIGSQTVGKLGALALATRARRIALSMAARAEYLEFVGGQDLLGVSTERRPGLAVCIEGDTARPLRFALVDEHAMAQAVSAASEAVAAGTAAAKGNDSDR